MDTTVASLPTFQMVTDFENQNSLDAGRVGAGIYFISTGSDAAYYEGLNLT